MPEIRTWANSVGQQIENMTVDLVATTAAGISEANGDVFFVGRPASNNAQEWILKKITPTELNKMVYNYLTSSAIANLLASALGETKENDGVSIINSLAKNILGKNGCFTIQDTSNSEVTIPAEQRGLRCAILIVGSNTKIPSIFVLSRTALIGTIFEGDIKPSDITVNGNGSVSVKKNAALSLYYRYILMEW